MSETSLSTEGVAADLAAGPPATSESLPFTTDANAKFSGVLVPSGNINMLNIAYGTDAFDNLTLLTVVLPADFAAFIAINPAAQLVSGTGAVINLNFIGNPLTNYTLKVGYV
jgi:hypothetical protein